ncbi:MAG: response regulator transcription factor [Candidatus Krumholzibacteria bacterium]|nr:response regulator transcription factor [Candidatus Krumholzibacteria bacterium]
MRVLIVDDHAVVRRGLQQIVLDEYKDLVFGEAKNGQEALELVRHQEWDVVILDISMPGRSGLDVLKDIKKARPNTPVLVLSIHPEDQFAVRVLKAGASGYMTKETAPEELVSAVNKVVAGGNYVSEAFAEILASDLQRDASEVSLHKRLSDREYEVMIKIASGKTVSEIAEELSLSVKTISTYRARVLEKINMKGNAELTRYAIKHGLVD